MSCAPRVSASRRLSLKQETRRTRLVCPACRLGPTVWITQRAGSRKAGVATAAPVWRPCGSPVARSSLHAASSSGPAARCSAPSTPPPPSNEEFAAFTTTSTRRCVMSPRRTEIRMPPVSQVRYLVAMDFGSVDSWGTALYFWVIPVVIGDAIFPPIPSEMLVITGGALSAEGRANVFLVLVLAAVASWLGDMVVFNLFRRRLSHVL